MALLQDSPDLSEDTVLKEFLFNDSLLGQITKVIGEVTTYEGDALERVLGLPLSPFAPAGGAALPRVTLSGAASFASDENTNLVLKAMLHGARVALDQHEDVLKTSKLGRAALIGIKVLRVIGFPLIKSAQGGIAILKTCTPKGVHDVAGGLRDKLVGKVHSSPLSTVTTVTTVTTVNADPLTPAIDMAVVKLRLVQAKMAAYGLLPDCCLLRVASGFGVHHACARDYAPYHLRDTRGGGDPSL